MCLKVIEGIAIPFIGTAAGSAMIYVVVEELIPETAAGEHSNIGVVMFALGFTLMMRSTWRSDNTLEVQYVYSSI